MNKTNFENLLNAYYIEIPEIQRDYVQGRENSKKEIAKPFAEALFSALASRAGLCLDFIYGTVEKREDKNFLFLIDGQQRITTLFLLYYFLCVKTKEGNANILKNFSYSSRLSTKDFCRLLVENISSLSESKEVELSENIKNSPWFFSQCLEDPSVKNILSMLDIIEEESKKYDLAECLKNFKKIEFTFLDLSEDLGIVSAKEVYLKMNGRGKQLTDFEIFKSRLSKCLEDNNQKKLDGKWQNMFWNRRLDGKKETTKKETTPDGVDKDLYNFFYNMTWFFVLDKKNYDIEKFSLTDPKLFDNETAIYKKDSPAVQTIINMLTGLETLKDESHKILNPYKAFENFLQPSKDKDFTYQDRLLFYSLVLYLDKLSSFKEITLDSWYRVCYNLIQNTLYNSLEDAKKSKEALDKHCNAIAEGKNLCEGLENIGSFNSAQLAEEKLKLKLVGKGKIAEDELLKMESHKYFNGKLNFLLYFAGFEDDDINEGDIEQFKHYFEVAQYLFCKDNFSLFQKALLCQSEKKDYLIPIAKKISLGNLNDAIRDKKDTWHKFFDNNFGATLENEQNKRDLLKKLCDDIIDRIEKESQNKEEITSKKVAEKLEDIINGYLKDKTEKTGYDNWRYWFIAKDDVLKSNEIRLNDNNIYLRASNSTAWSLKRELYTYAFNLWCNSEGNQNGLKWGEYKGQENYGVKGPFLPKAIKINGTEHKINFNLYYLANKSGFVLYCFKDNLPEGWLEQETSNGNAPVTSDIAEILGESKKVYKKELGQPSFKDLAEKLKEIEREIQLEIEKITIKKPI